MGCVPPKPGYLEGLRAITQREGALLILDEVMTGFRLAFGGASELYGIKADLVTLGKIIGGGLPVGAYGGPAKIMDLIAPLGPVYQAGTLSGNPLAMAAGITTLWQLKDNRRQYYRQLDEYARTWWQAFSLRRSRGCRDDGQPRRLHVHVLLHRQTVTDWDSAATCDTAKFGRFHNAMLNAGNLAAALAVRSGLPRAWPTRRNTSSKRSLRRKKR